MHIEKTGALVSRGIGAGLMIMGVSSILYWPLSYYEPSGLVTSGWTSYSPNATTTTQTVGLQDRFYLFITNWQLYVPSSAQILAGLFMLVWSKPVGRWLASGLDDREETK
jgi:hypothetical protein